MFSTTPQAQPGVYGPYTSQPRDIWFSNAQFAQYIAPPVIIDGSLSSNPLNIGTVVGPGDYRWLLWAGMPMGRITATNKYRNSIIGLTTASTTSTTVTASTATVNEVARLITLAGTAVSLTIVGPPTAAGTVATATVSATAASGTSITLASNSTTYISGSLLMPADGSQTIVGVLADNRNVVLVNDVFDRVDAQTDRIAYAGGTINTGMIPNYPSDSSLKTWLKAQIGTSFAFMDNQVT